LLTAQTGAASHHEMIWNFSSPCQVAFSITCTVNMTSVGQVKCQSLIFPGAQMTWSALLPSFSGRGHFELLIRCSTSCLFGV